ncbi:hypothetical protein ACFOKF_17740 [Sphingobium rhizovicinum]|uniref:LPXTG cell wall anchor domain-containing protein n=1 Tax=Sphingobium rhizovicinum TaxID=432308 RepID=A0ABV7NJN0_9SPHN
MGFLVRPLLFAAPLMLAAPLHAQQTEAPATGLPNPPATTAPTPDPNRQGPELNVFRDPVTPRASQPVITPPPVTVQPVPQQAPARPAASRPTTTTAPATPRQTKPEPKAQRPAEREKPTPQATPAPAAPTEEEAAANQSAPVETAPQSLPVPVPATNAVEPSAPVATPAPTAEDGLSLPWIIGGVIALVLLAAFLLLRRRRAPAPAVESAAPPRPAPQPAKPAPAEPAPQPVAPPPITKAPVAASADRPWIDMDMAVSQARYSLMGLTVAYSLILHNRGDRPAQDILIRGIMGNAGAQQAALLQDFFTGDTGLPLHSAVSIAPGETIQLGGELRLSPDEIAPVTMGQRSLLIPLAAFDMAYRWATEGDALDQGRTARAFIVGQEQEPPAERLAPLRLDQGPRQYRRPAARAAAELTPA